MKDRTPSWKCFLEIPEATQFTEEEKQVLKDAMAILPRFTIDDAWCITRLRLWADTQPEIDAARVILGKAVIHILNERKI